MSHAGITGPAAADDHVRDADFYALAYAELKRLARHHRRAVGPLDTLSEEKTS